MSVSGVRRDKAALFQWVQVPPGNRSSRKQPEQLWRKTKWLKPSGKRVTTYGDSANVQAVTRVNAEQASKRTMRRPTRLPFRGRLTRLGEMSDAVPQSLRRGSGDSMYIRKARATREAPRRGQPMTNRRPARDRPGALG